MKPNFKNALLPSEDGWYEESDKNDVIIYSRNSRKSEIKEKMMIGIMNASTDVCWSIISNYEAYSEFMPFMKWVKTIHFEKIDPLTTINYVFFYAKPPLISDRYYTLALTDRKNADGRKGVFRSNWKSAREAGKDCLCKTPKDPEIKKNIRTGFQKPVETVINEGYSLIEPFDEGNKTRVTYYLWHHPSGAIPDWIANKLNSIALPEIWKVMKQRLINIHFSKTVGEPHD